MVSGANRIGREKTASDPRNNFFAKIEQTRYARPAMEIIFEWNELKARENLRKHQVNFEEAKTIFNDSLLLTFRDEVHSNYEERYISIGFSAENEILLVVHTEHEQDEGLIIRIISSRKATTSERKVYEEGES